ncbi:unnamed protein product [Owenia fusiformis]|uniref:Peptidase M14 domain-containing protein n=1 Tax=Owenia fusiformis TaxID=6347 RepID=A0A8J1TUI7_OWEFU|nr:unnamed protein product [Owenia fusiformis]
MKLMLVLALAVTAVCASKVRYDGYQLVHVTPKSDEHVKILAQMQGDSTKNGLMFWTEPVSVERMVDVMVPPHAFIWMARTLRDNEMPYTLADTDVQKMIDEEDAENNVGLRRMRTRVGNDATQYSTILGAYQRHSTINGWLNSIASSYSNIASVFSIGKTYEGRDMRVIKIGKAGAKNKAIWIDAGIHAREWIAPSTSLYIINQLLTGYNRDATITRLVDTFDWYILPVANPDGYEYSHTSNRMWRKTRSPTKYSWCTGADPNRNFDAAWNSIGTSPNPCSDTYAGDSPFSEANTRNMRDAINSLKDRMAMYLSFHSYSQMWLTPYAYTSRRPVDYAEMERVANIGATALQKVYGTSYIVGSPPQILYAAAGGSYDWAKMYAGVKYSYTLELRPGRGASNGFILSPSQITPNGREVWASVIAVTDALKLDSTSGSGSGGTWGEWWGKK